MKFDLQDVESRGFYNKKQNGTSSIDKKRTIANWSNFNTEVPDNRHGVYMVLTLNSTPIPFITDNNPYYAKVYKNVVLKEKWQETPNVLYIGKTSGKTTSLHKRINQYLNHKQNHNGGKAIWQIQGHLNFVIVWKELTPTDAVLQEKALLNEFRCEYKHLPLANWRR